MPTGELQYFVAPSVKFEMADFEKNEKFEDSKRSLVDDDDLKEQDFAVRMSGILLKSENDDHNGKSELSSSIERKGEEKMERSTHINSLRFESSSRNRILTYAEVLTRTKTSTTFPLYERSQMPNPIVSNLIFESPQNEDKVVCKYAVPTNRSGDELQSIPEKSRGEALSSKTEIAASTQIFPRTIKVYKLLATQSEDRCDMDATTLVDSRISLQITRHQNEKSSSTKKLADQKLSHSESVPSLKVTEFSDLKLRSLSPSNSSILPTKQCFSPREISATNRNISDINSIAMKPIYPYCPYSPYGSPQGSPPTRRKLLRESKRISIDNRHGALQLNQYKLLDNIGQGSYGIVKLVFNEEDNAYYAMKILSKKKLMKKAGIFGRMAPGKKGTLTPLAKVYREIALLKKLDHPNVVKLIEVLDDPEEDNLYLVFELVQKGEVLQVPTDKPINEETAREYFRDVVLGIEYLHYQRIVHRDIKPSNLLVDGEGRLKIADLGVSAELRTSGELLIGSAGTPAFAAPETTTLGSQYSGTPCDIWSLGVTLYSLVTGRVPWDGAGSIIGVHAAVRTEPLRFPETPSLSAELCELISLMLVKDPLERITLSQIKEHRWLTNDGTEPLPHESDNCRLPVVTVTDEEMESVVTRVPKLDTLILIKTMLKQHSFQNPFIIRKHRRSIYNEDDANKSRDSCSTQSEFLEPIKLESKSEQFHKSGRSYSAPDSYDWKGINRQTSTEIQLPPVEESVIEVMRRREDR